MGGLVSLMVAALATWRITCFLYYDWGPWDVFIRIRALAGAHERPPEGFWAKLFSCFWCLSVWAGLLCAVVWWFWWWALIPFALSGAAILLSGGGRVIAQELENNG